MLNDGILNCILHLNASQGDGRNPMALLHGKRQSDDRSRKQNTGCRNEALFCLDCSRCLPERVMSSSDVPCVDPCGVEGTQPGRIGTRLALKC